MGCSEFVTADKWPEQDDVGATVKVCFHYDLTRQFPGKFLRNDMTEPFTTVIQLEDGRVVLGTECQYSYD